MVSIDQLTAVLADSAAALPHLTRFGLHELPAPRQRAHDLAPLITALATVPVALTGRPRAIERLDLDVPAPLGVLANAAAMPALFRLRIAQARPGRLEDWTEAQKTQSAFSAVQELIVDTRWRQHYIAAGADTNRPRSSTTDLHTFLRSMANCPLHVLEFHTGDPITFDAAAMSQLANCRQLQRCYRRTRHTSEGVLDGLE